MLTVYGVSAAQRWGRNEPEHRDPSTPILHLQGVLSHSTPHPIGWQITEAPLREESVPLSDIFRTSKQRHCCFLLVGQVMMMK